MPKRWHTRVADKVPQVPVEATALPTLGPSSVDRPFTLHFWLIVVSGLAYFLALAMLNPVIPFYVKHALGGGGLAVGVGIGSFSFGAIMLRPFAGRIGDRRGRKVLLVGGALVVAIATSMYGTVASLPWLVGVRLIAGIGEAAFFVGAATMITDLAPEDRRGEAVSYWSIAVYGGLAAGPYLGEVVLGAPGREHYQRAWLISAALALFAVLIGVFTRDPHGGGHRIPRVGGADANPKRQPLLHPNAIAPGFVLFLGLISLAGWSGFVKLYAKSEMGLNTVGGVFLTYGAIVLVVRIVGSKLPDRLGARRAGSASLVFAAVGIAVVALWPYRGGLYFGTALFALGMSLLYPAMLVLTLDGVPASERGSVVGTFSSFFDLSQGIGAALCGATQAAFGYRAMFAMTAVAAIAGLVYLRTSVTSMKRKPPETVL